jgi:hypothetical protein
MGLIQVVIVLVVVGVVLWLVQTRVPLDPTIKTVINVVVVLAVCLWLLRFAGIF